MSSWVLVPSLVSLREEFNQIAPNRDKSSDGSIGDDAHADSSSDHNPDETGTTPDEDSDSKNEVHAIDVDKDLKSSFTMQQVVDYLVNECRKSGTSGKDKGRLKYIIFNGYIYDAPSWSKAPYYGANAHDQHAHFSAEYDSEFSEDTSSWGLVERFGDLTKEEMLEVLNSPEGQAAIQKAAGIGVHNQPVGHSGLTIGVMTQRTYNNVNTLVEALPGEPDTSEVVCDGK